MTSVSKIINIDQNIYDEDDIILMKQAENHIKEQKFTEKSSASCTIRYDTNILKEMFFIDNSIKLMNYGYSGDGRYQFYYYRDNENNKYDFWAYSYYTEMLEIKEFVKLKYYKKIETNKYY